MEDIQLMRERINKLEHALMVVGMWMSKNLGDTCAGEDQELDMVFAALAACDPLSVAPHISRDFFDLDAYYLSFEAAPRADDGAESEE